MRARSTLLCHTSAHDGHKGMAQHTTDNGETRPRVATGQFDDGLTIGQFSRFLGVQNDLFGNAIFLREPWIEILQFGANATLTQTIVVDLTRKIHQWSVSNGTGNVWQNAAGSIPNRRKRR